MSVYPVEEVDTVFRRLSQCQINGRAVLRVCSDADSFGKVSSSSVFQSGSVDSFPPLSPTTDEPMLSPSPDVADGSGTNGIGFFLS
jgi:hypothetical protein